MKRKFTVSQGSKRAPSKEALPVPATSIPVHCIAPSTLYSFLFYLPPPSRAVSFCIRPLFRFVPGSFGFSSLARTVTLGRPTGRLLRQGGSRRILQAWSNCKELESSGEHKIRWHRITEPCWGCMSSSPRPIMTPNCPRHKM